MIIFTEYQSINNNQIIISINAAKERIVKDYLFIYSLTVCKSTFGDFRIIS